jgi:hypothetical protein
MKIMTSQPPPLLPVETYDNPAILRAVDAMLDRLAVLLSLGIDDTEGTPIVAALTLDGTSSSDMFELAANLALTDDGEETRSEESDPYLLAHARRWRMLVETVAERVRPSFVAAVTEALATHTYAIDLSQHPDAAQLADARRWWKMPPGKRGDPLPSQLAAHCYLCPECFEIVFPRRRR